MELLVDPGSVLAASPDLKDPNFMHTVVLMCQHTVDGALGLVINRPSGLTVDQLLPEHPLLARQKRGVFTGGPVGLNTLQFLHVLPQRIPGGIELGRGLWLGGELEALAAYLAEFAAEADRHVRLVVGYSGWSSGQLESELASGSWVPAPIEPAWVFEADPSTMWRRVLRSLGNETAGLEDLPPDVSWN